MSRSPNGQIVLFGCPPELRTVGEQKKIPPILEYLLDSVQSWSGLSLHISVVGQKPKIVQLTHYIVSSKNTGLW